MTGHYATRGLSAHFATTPIFGATGKRIGTHKVLLDELLSGEISPSQKGFRWRNMSCYTQFIYAQKKARESLA